MVWLLVFAKVCCGCLPSGECNFSCTQIGDNSGCLDALSLTLPRYCLDVGRSAKAETCTPATPLRMNSGASAGWRSGGEVKCGQMLSSILTPVAAECLDSRAFPPESNRAWDPLMPWTSFPQFLTAPKHRLPHPSASPPLRSQQFHPHTQST
jgi:hypothetical protein